MVRARPCLEMASLSTTGKIGGAIGPLPNNALQLMKRAFMPFALRS